MGSELSDRPECGCGVADGGAKLPDAPTVSAAVLAVAALAPLAPVRALPPVLRRPALAPAPAPAPPNAAAAGGAGVRWLEPIDDACDAGVFNRFTWLTGAPPVGGQSSSSSPSSSPPLPPDARAGCAGVASAA